MVISGISCGGCGSFDVDFDPVTRKLKCHQCGREEFYSRARLSMSGKVTYAKENAIRFFKEGNIQSAKQFASDVLNMMEDHSASLFIMAYADEFREGKNGSMRSFFASSQDISLEYDEVRDLIDLFETTLYNMHEFEDDMVLLMIKNMQSEEDRRELENFIDTVCPYCINQYSSIDFLDTTRADMYREIAENCDIPKTLFALLKGIKDNPESPLVATTYTSEAKKQYFIDHYAKQVGDILMHMKDSPYKGTFLKSYEELLRLLEK